jgi:peptidoglycan hydrolase-like protein with peptidoglycan-binding domain
MSVAAASALALLAILGVAASADASTASPGGTSTEAAVTTPTPAEPSGLPSGIEALAAYVPADSCDPVVRPGTEDLGDLLVATYPHTSYGITRTCGSDPLPTSEHYDGRAVDWMVSVRDPQQKAEAQAVISWLFAKDAAGNTYANARRLGVMYVIWNNRIWGAYRAADGWRPYSTCASHPEAAYDTTCHRNHVHISLSWEGAMGRTSFWTKTPAATDYGPCRAADLNWATHYTAVNPTPCPSYPSVKPAAAASSLDKTLTTYSGMRVKRGFTGTVVSAIQKAVGVSVDGTFGSLTRQAVQKWQTTHALTATGVVNAPTWRALLKANAPTPLPPSGSRLDREHSVG